ncbi:ECF RNA polymerase sigma factor SigE [Frondihabitans sp. 762G35]|nr:ECF RNA polymerase sigma factor SigE [Frondihabitans sp. 762G35]
MADFELNCFDCAIASVSTDRDVIRRSRENPAVFAELYDRHAKAIHRFVARRLTTQVADDLVSETFLVAFERRRTFDESREDALPWLYGIVTTLLKKHRRLEAREWRAGLSSRTREAVDQPGDDSLEAALVVARLRGALRGMAAGDRDALLLYAWGDLDYEGVAVALGVPVGTVRSRLNRARRTLRIAAGRFPAEEVDHGRTDIAPNYP